MFVTILRIPSFRAYYQTAAGAAVLAIAAAIFFGLVWAVGRIVRVIGWTRWELRLLAEQEAHPRA